MATAAVLVTRAQLWVTSAVLPYWECVKLLHAIHGSWLYSASSSSSLWSSSSSVKSFTLPPCSGKTVWIFRPFYSCIACGSGVGRLLASTTLQMPPISILLFLHLHYMITLSASGVCVQWCYGRQDFVRGARNEAPKASMGRDVENVYSLRCWERNTKGYLAESKYGECRGDSAGF